MALLHLELFGDYRMRSESGALISMTSKKSQAMLAYLGVRPEQLVSRDKMAALLWSSTAPEQARQSLRQTLSSLRKELAQISSDRKILREEGDFLSIDPELVRVDVAELESLALGSEESLDRAVRLYEGDFLDGFLLDEEKFDLWVLAERDRLKRLALRIHGQLADTQARNNNLDAAIATTQRALRIDALQEWLHQKLMRLYLQTGDLSNALQQYDTCAKTLRRELRVEPDAETKALYQQIVQLRTRRTTSDEKSEEHKPTVLVVEDNLLNRELTNALLKTAGYDVMLAKDGAEALMLLGREKVDLILLDIDLPFIDGHKVLEALKEKGIEVPTIFLSGLPGEAPELRAFEIGAADFIRKPVKNNVLLARVAKVLKES